MKSTNKESSFVIVRSEIIEYCKSKEEALKTKAFLDQLNRDDCTYSIEEVSGTAAGQFFNKTT